MPGQHETGLALPWGGTSHPVWFKRDPRVANVKVLGGVFDRALMQGVPQIVAAALAQIEGLSEEDKYKALSEQAAAVMNQMPPRESTRINTSLDSVHASGPIGAGALRDPRQLQLQADRRCCRRTRPTRCCSSRRGGPASRPAARPSATVSCWACCAASAW